MKRPLLTIAGLTILAAFSPAVVIYQNDFESNAVGFSNTTRTLAPNASTSFLGRFSAETNTLTLSGLAAHGQITLSMDVFVIHSWDGDNSLGNGPDVLKFSADGTDYLNANFSNWQPTQSYSDATPLGGGPFAAKTGNDGIGTLGYNDFFGTDTLYKMNFTLSHSASTLTLDFSGVNLQGVGDESWGIDNLVVSSNAVPEPMSMGALSVGVAVLFRRKRRG